jgi:hypothetical protein
VCLEARAKRDDCRQRERLAEPQDPSQTKLPQSGLKSWFDNLPLLWKPGNLAGILSQPCGESSARGTYISTGSRGC